MGLDMYLSRKYYLSKEDKERILGAGLSFSFSNLQDESITLEREVIYWRKANAIHDWFVKNIQNNKDDCGYYYVHEEALETLLELVTTVLNDHSKASELLPTKDGFFFGGVDYGDDYFSDLVHTKKMLTHLLAEKMSEGVCWDYFYHSSW
jgi:hypothetical protein